MNTPEARKIRALKKERKALHNVITKRDNELRRLREVMAQSNNALREAHKRINSLEFQVSDAAFNELIKEPEPAPRVDMLRECELVWKGQPRKVDSERITSSRAVSTFFRKVIPSAPQERFCALALDVKNRPIGWCEIARGGLHACPVSPRDVFRFLMVASAAGVVFVHNHPTGEVTPSAEDFALTDRLVKAGNMLGVTVLDHVIIATDSDRYFSFLDSGLIPRK